MTQIESELEFENYRNLQSDEFKYWPLLSVLDADFLLQIEKVMSYGWNDTDKRNLIFSISFFSLLFLLRRYYYLYLIFFAAFEFNAALIVTKDGNVYSLDNKWTLNQSRLCDCATNYIPEPQKIKALCQKNIKTMIGSNEPCLFILTEEGKVY
jgi:hypothetical protein